MMDATLYRYSLPLTQAIEIRGHRMEAREGLLLKWGKNWGEIAPLPGLSRETLEEASAEAIVCLKSAKQGRHLAPQLPSVQFGFDCARRNWPKSLKSPHSPYILLLGSPEEIVWGWREWLYDYPTKAKIKVGRYPMRDEIAMIRELCRLAPKLKLILDANQGWSREEAWTFMSHLNPANLEYVEDPCASFEDVRTVAGHTGIPVALDELLSTELPWENFSQLKGLVIKPTLIGSLDKCKALVERGHALGIKVILSSCYESQVGNRLLTQLAGEWAPEQAPGLDTLRYLAGSLLNRETGEVDESRLEVLWQG